MANSVFGSFDPRLMQQDYSGIANAAQMQTAGAVGGFQSALDGVTDYFKGQKEAKLATKTAQQRIQNAIGLFPSRKAEFEGMANVLKDENRPLAERAALAKDIDAAINMHLGEGRYQQEMALRQQASDTDQMQAYSSINANNARTNAVGDEARRSRELAAANTPVLLDMLKQQNAQTGVLNPQAIERYAQIQDPQVAADAIMSAIKLSAPDKTEFSDVRDFKVGDKIMQGRMNLRTGVVQPAMVPTDGFDPSALPEPLQDHAQAFATAGAKYGVDPKVLAAIAMHETGNGTSAAFRQKHNAMGVSNNQGPVDTGTVDASIDKMAALLAAGQRGEGPYAGKTTIREIAGVYAPVGAANDPRGQNKDWSSGVGSALKRLGGDPDSSIALKGMVPAVSSSAKDITPELAYKIQKDAKTDTINAGAAIAKSTELLANLEKLDKHEGFSNVFGSNVGIPTWVAGTDAADAKTVYEQLNAQGFLEAVKSMQGMGALSDTEGAKLDKAFLGLSTKMSEPAAHARIAEVKALVEKGIAKAKAISAANLASEPPPPQVNTKQAAAGRLNSLIKPQI